MKFPALHRSLFAPSFAKGVVCFAMVCGGVLFHFRDAARPTHSRADLKMAAAVVERTAPAPLYTPLPKMSFPVPAVSAPVKKSIKKVARVASKKKIVKRSKLRKIAPAVKSELDNVEPAWIEGSLAAVESVAAEDAEQALDVVGPLDELVTSELAESDLASDYAEEPGSVAWQLDQNWIADKEIARVPRLGEIAGVYKKNGFSEIRARLNTLPEDLEPIAPAPAPRKVAVEKTSPPAKEKKVAVSASNVLSPVLAGAAAVAASASKTAVAAVSAAPASAPPVAAPLKALAVEPPAIEVAHAPSPSIESKPEPELVVPSKPEPELVAPSKPEPELATAAPKKETKAPEPTLVVSTQAAAASAASLATRGPATQPKLAMAGIPFPNRQNDEDESRLIDEKIFGKIAVDEAFSKWLVANKGHIELNLHAVGSRDPLDTIPVDYKYPSPEFQKDARQLRGSYWLRADIYTASGKAPYSQVLYRRDKKSRAPFVIGADTAKENIYFAIEMREVEAGKLAAPNRSRSLTLSSTIFEGASGDPKTPLAITGGKVQVIGFPEYGQVNASVNGNFLIPHVPGRSELLLRIEAKGFFPSYRIVPTFATDQHQPVYLLSRDKVDVITRYFTKHLQESANGLLMGRVFDPVTRNPLADERLSLSFRRGGAIYFSALGALPMIPTVASSAESATTINGMFAFFNLAPTMRAVSRASGKPSHLVNVHAGSGEYVEFGRGGVRNLRGRVVDQGRPLGARVRLVGDRKVQVDTAADGTFVIPNLDLPPGAVTLEVEARGYPRTWFTVGWNPREPEQVRTLVMAEKELIYGRLARSADTKAQSGKGVLVGHNSIFPKHVNCVVVSLTDAEGKAVETAHGPFPWMSRVENPTGKTCLTRQRPRFSYFNLEPGEYVVRLTTPENRVVGSHVVRVGSDRVSITVH